MRECQLKKDGPDGANDCDKLVCLPVRPIGVAELHQDPRPPGARGQPDLPHGWSRHPPKCCPTAENLRHIYPAVPMCPKNKGKSCYLRFAKQLWLYFAEPKSCVG